jgi:3'-5' exoribonuclease
MATVVMVRSVEVRPTRKGGRFASLRLNLGREGDFSEVEAKIWGVDAALEAGVALPAEGDLIEVDYKADEYQGRPQWIVQSYRAIEGDARTALLDLFSPPQRIDRDYYVKRLDALIGQIDPERACGQVLCAIYDDAGFREAFYHAPAAKVHHQNYPGGLLEHTVNVTTLALALADAYAPPPAGTGLSFNRFRVPIDRQVLLAAGLLHDIGKIQTYRFSPLADVTETNAWEGHLVISYETVKSHARPMLEQPPYPGAADELNKLLHCILAHHGTLEYGSPVPPSCVEAFLLSQADMTDARVADIVEAAREGLGNAPATRWLGRQFHFPGGVFVGDWPRAEKSE